MQATESPFPQYFDLEGRPLDGGSLYFGVVNQDPESHPIAVFWDDAGALPAAQPIRTMRGYAARSGTPAIVYAGSDYSLTVKDKAGVVVFYAANSVVFGGVAALRSGLAGPDGSSMIGFRQSGADAVQRILQDKARERVSASDFGAAGVDVGVDSAAILQACTEHPGAIIIIDSFIAKSIDLPSLSLPTNVTLIDERYASDGWFVVHAEGDDAQIMLRGRATSLGEGPSLVLANLASTGNRNVSLVAWAKDGGGSWVATSYAHMGHTADGTWYPGWEFLTAGSIDGGFRARMRMGNDGGIVFNPTGDAASARNNPAVGFSQNIFFDFGAPLQSGYTYSSKPLFRLAATTASVPLILELQTDTGTPGAAVANATLRFQGGNSALGTKVNHWSIIDGFPSAGQLTLYDHVAGGNKWLFNTGGDSVHTGVIKPAVDNTSSLGTGALRWSVVYAGTGAINTSDSREKQDIAALTDAEKRVGVRLKALVKSYKWTSAVQAKGADARTHVGWIAQDVIAAFQAETLDPFTYGVCCYDQWPAVEAVVDEDGNVLQPAQAAGDRYSLRHDELVAFILGSL